MDVSHARLSNADYMSLPEDGKRYELHEGVLIEMPSPSPLHVWVVTLLVRVISNYVIERSLGFVAADNLDYFMDEGVILKPDVSFAAGVFPPFAKRFEFAPDLAVEVLSPSNSASEINYKVKSYLQYGSRLVWVIDPDKALATIYHKQADGQIVTTHLTIDGSLTGEDILPGFTLAMKELFNSAS